LKKGHFAVYEKKAFLIAEVYKTFQTKDWESRSTIKDEWRRKGKAFCERPFALHRQQPEKEQSFDVSLPLKISAKTNECTDFDLNLGS